MKLRLYTPTDLGSMPKTGPYIHISKKAGTFCINKAACELIGLVPDDRVLLGSDPDFPENWFIHPCGKNQDNAFLLRSKKEISSGLLFNSCQLAKIFFKELKLDGEKSITLPIGTEPVKNKTDMFWPIITKAVKKGTES